MDSRRSLSFILLGIFLTGWHASAQSVGILDPRIQAADTLSVKPGVLDPAKLNPNSKVPPFQMDKMPPATPSPEVTTLVPKKYPKPASSMVAVEGKKVSAKVSAKIPAQNQKVTQKVTPKPAETRQQQHTAKQEVPKHEAPTEPKNNNKLPLRIPKVGASPKFRSEEQEQEEGAPCFGKKPCTRPLPDPYKPSDWKAPELITVPKKEQKTEIPMYRNDISCCGAKGDNYLTGPTSAIHSLKPMPGIMQTDRVTGKTYMGPKNKTGPNPKCRPCSPSKPKAYYLPEKAPPKEFTPQIVMLEESAAPADLIDGAHGENNKMLFTPSEVLKDGTQKLKNKAYTEINAYDSKIKAWPHSHAEIVDKLDDPMAPCENCPRKHVQAEFAKCKNCGPHLMGFVKPEMKAPKRNAPEISVVALETSSQKLSKEMCACECVSAARFAQARKEIPGACPPCPKCAGDTEVKVDCDKLKEAAKRPECAPTPGAPMALHKYRAIQKHLSVIPEISSGSLTQPQTATQ